MKPTFFEGPEKKVELATTLKAPSLRTHGREFWDSVVIASGAQVLSVLSSDLCDAYLLSESSLFVHDDHLTMITCGRTRLVEAVARILERVPPSDVALLMYERKNEHFPDRQPSSFYQDAQRLASWIPGRALRFGDEHDHHVHPFHTTQPYVAAPSDTTLEILMHGLPEERSARFIGCARPASGTLAGEWGIERILPGFEIDEHPFTPAGYSMNALRGSDYYTIHVTPEQLGSYVSFETNVDFRGDLQGLVSQVVEVFSPRSFDVMAFVPEGTAHESFGVAPPYLAKDRVHAQVNGYDIRFCHAYRPSDVARAPAVVTL